MALVTVGCKLPQGLIIEMGYEAVPGGIKKSADYKAVTLNGANQHSVLLGSLRTPSPADLRPGITNNVDEAFFDAWVEAHKDTNLVKNKLVFKAKNAGEATAQAADLTKKKIGMEAVDPSKHPSVVKRTED